MRARQLIALLVCVALCPLALLARAAAAPEALTTLDQTMPVAELELLLKPLTKPQLLIEADAWQRIVQEKAEQIASGEITVRRQNAEIEAAATIREQAEVVKETLEEVRQTATVAAASGNPEAAVEVRAKAEDAEAKMLDIQQQIEVASDAAERTAEMRQQVEGAIRDSLEETAEAAEHAAAQVEDVTTAIDDAVARIQGGEDMAAATDKVRRRASHAAAATDQTVSAAEQAEAQAAAAEQAGEQAREQPELLAHAAELAATEAAKRDEKLALLESVTVMREERKLLIDRFDAVLSALEAKTPEQDTKTLALIADHRLYIRAVSGIQVDMDDTTSAWVAIKGWATSKEGGIRLAVNLARFFGVLILAWLVAKLLSAGVQHGLRRVEQTSKLLEEFLAKTVRWGVMSIGIIMALAQLEISVGPLLAVIGAAGFVVAFALQDSLSNFASGLMILIFRPFDIGDLVDAGGVSGEVQSMNLISTTIKTLDNKLMVALNNKIFSDVITNETGVRERRVDMEFGIAYDADADLAQAILDEIVTGHPKVLTNPPPTIALHTLGDDSIHFIARPWTRPADYWEVYWDVTKAVKKRFDAAGIGNSLPHRILHLHVRDGIDPLVPRQGD